MRVFSFPELPLYLQVTTSTVALKMRMILIIREQNECIAVCRNKVIEGFKSFYNTKYLLILSQFDIQSPCNKVVSWETASVFRIKACMEGLTGLIALCKLIQRNTFFVCVCQKQRSTKGIGKGLPDSCLRNIGSLLLLEPGSTGTHSVGGGEKEELAMISHKFSFPPRKPRDTAKRENCHYKRAAY